MSATNAPQVMTKDDVRERCAGMENLELYVIFTRRVAHVALTEMRTVTSAHLAFQHDLEQRGILWAAGPLFGDDDRTWDGDGLVIVRAASLAEARAIAAADPMHSRGVRAFEVRPWMLNEGSLTVRVTFSDRGRMVL